MDLLNLIGDYLVPFLVILTILVFIHELGHYLAARRCGVKIDAFSIGFGPELFGWYDKHGTRWKVSALPLGGYVKMFGDADVTSRPASTKETEEETGNWAGGVERPLTDEERAGSFHHKTLGQRTFIVAAGPLANFLFAAVLLAGFFAFVKQPTTPPEIGQVLEGSPAESADLRPGDRIIAVNGAAIERFEQIQRQVQLNLDQPLQLLVLRDGQEIELSVRPEIVDQEDNFGNIHRMARLGIAASGTEYVRYGPGEALWRAGEETVSLTTATLKALGQIVTGVRSTDELGGPVRIAEMSGHMAMAGLVSVVWFMAVLSVNLGLINLFPVPMLDGGHLLFYAIEAVRGRPLGEKAQEIGFRIGLALVLMLFVFVTWNDLVRIEFFSMLQG